MGDLEVFQRSFSRTWSVAATQQWVERLVRVGPGWDIARSRTGIRVLGVSVTKAGTCGNILGYSIELRPVKFLGGHTLGTPV